MGHLASKSNGRRPRRGRWIKSQVALDFVDAFAWQIALHRPKTAFTGNVALFAWVWYADRRRDLDIALLQDQIQNAGIIKNDRQVIEIHAMRFVDKHKPRVKFELREVA
jgi:Holliday junction resolvase RusA-like endonuclease